MIFFYFIRTQFASKFPELDELNDIYMTAFRNQRNSLTSVHIVRGNT